MHVTGVAQALELQFEDAFVEPLEKLNELWGGLSSYAQLHLLRRLVSDRGGALVNELAAPDRLALLGELLSPRATSRARPSPARRTRRRRGEAAERWPVGAEGRPLGR